MARIPVNAPGVSTAGAGAATLWKAMATAAIIPPATTPDYRFGELLSEVSGSWSNSSQGTALAIAPPLNDRLPLSSYESAIAAASPKWICYADGSNLQVRELLWRDSSGAEQGPVYLAGDTIIDANAADIVAIKSSDPREFGLASRQAILVSDTVAIGLADLPGGIPDEAESAYIQISGYARMLSVDSNVFPLVRGELFGFYFFPTRDTLTNARFRLPTAAEYAQNPVAQQVSASPSVAWSYAPAVGSMAAAGAVLATGRLDGLCVLTATFSNQQGDGGFKIISDVTQSVFDAMMIGEQVARAPQPSALESQSLYPVIVATSSAVVMPATGATVAIPVRSITAPNGATIGADQAFRDGDLVQLSQYDPAGMTVREAYFTVNSVVGDSVTATALTRAGQGLMAAAGETFASGSELTGQTRLTPPMGATQASIYVSDNLNFQLALVDSTNARNRVASIIAQRFPMLQVSLSGDVDPVQSPGIPLTAFGEIKLETAADIAGARIFCATLLQFRPALYVVYR
jgi:hypothetical protein